MPIVEEGIPSLLSQGGVVGLDEPKACGPELLEFQNRDQENA